MIKFVRVHNFKSLSGNGDDFVIELGRFTCLIGLNGAGKTTLLQFLDFAKHIMLGKVGAWLDERGWTGSDLNYLTVKTIKSRKRNIRFEVVVDGVDGDIKWEGEYSRDKRFLVYERIVQGNEVLLEVEKGAYRLRDGAFVDSSIHYEGSLVGALLETKLPPSLMELKRALAGVVSRELLSPSTLRKNSRGKPEDIGRYGETISAYTSTLESSKSDDISKQLKKLYPYLGWVFTISKRAGWKKMFVSEDRGEDRVFYSAQHASDGFLRMLAVILDVDKGHSCLLLEEVENGINPEVLGKLVGMLLTCRSQVVITTHSPLVLNYIDEREVRKSVRLMYKTVDGFSRAANFYDIPEVSERLNYMSSGEVFLDVSLEDISDKLANQ